jgi:hypothetical protein
MMWAVRKSVGAVRKSAAGMLVVLVSLGVARAQGSGANTGQGSAAAGERIVREIKDPHSGTLWRLYANAENPAGPGRLVMAGREEHGTSFTAQTKKSVPAIHAGQRVMVEEHSSAVEAYLEGTALESSPVGSRLQVRLRMGGKVVRALVTAPGRVEVQP